MKNFSIIVAIAQNYAIGKDNQLLWHLSEDLKRFKKLTKGKTVIMGEKTYLSLPIRPLPNRKNIVICAAPDVVYEGCNIAHSIEEAIALADDGEENFIIGGGSIYSQFMPIASKLYLTKVHKNFDADIFFPEIDPTYWEPEGTEEVCYSEETGLTFGYQTFRRK